MRLFHHRATTGYPASWVTPRIALGMIMLSLGPIISLQDKF